MKDNEIYLSNNLTPGLKKMVETFYAAFMNPELLDEVLDEGFIDHMPFNPGSPAGIDGFKKHLPPMVRYFQKSGLSSTEYMLMVIR